MTIEVISRRERLLIRRQVLEPGEAMYWHIDRCHRFAVVVRGSRLTIEYRDGDAIELDVAPGMADWDASDARVHRAVNTGSEPFEEVVTFYLDADDQEPQPIRT